MNKFKTSLIALGGLLLLIGAIALVSPNASQGDSLKDVNVVNTASNPVPTVAQGTTNIAGNVGINPSSNIIKIDSSANTVKVENSANPLLVNDVSVSPTRQASVYFGSQALPAGQSEITVPAFDVPAGNRWVIEYVNIEANAPGDFGASVFLHAPFGSSQIKYNLLTRPNEAPFGIVVSQQVKIYVDPGQTQLRFRRTPPMGQETIFDFVLSGHLEAIE
jgi:hypothetical protein